MFDDLLNTDQSIALEPPNSSSMEKDTHIQSLTQAHTALATLDEESKFVDTYFAYYNTLYPMLHENTFRSVKYGQTAPPHWAVLSNMVLALGAWLSSDSHQGLDKIYFARAEDCFEKIPTWSQGNLVLTQGLVLLSEFAQKQGNPETSGRYIGSAVQMAVALNLHMEPQDHESTELDKEIRRRVWWSVYCAESCSAKIYGRPLLLPEDALTTVKSVSNIHENVSRSLFKFCILLSTGLLTYNVKSLMFSSTSFPPQCDESSIHMGLMQQSSYHRLANRIYRYLLSCSDFTARQVQEAREMIDEWHKRSSLCLQVTNPSSAPDWYLIARRRQVRCDRSLRLLIHRPLLLRWWKRKSIDEEASTSAEDQCRAQNLNIARTTIDMISESFISSRYSKLTLSFTLYDHIDLYWKLCTAHHYRPGMRFSTHLLSLLSTSR